MKQFKTDKGKILMLLIYVISGILLLWFLCISIKDLIK